MVKYPQHMVQLVILNIFILVKCIKDLVFRNLVLILNFIDLLVDPVDIEFVEHFVQKHKGRLSLSLLVQRIFK